MAYWAVIAGCVLMLASGMLHHRLFLGLGTAKLFLHLGLWASVAGLATWLRTSRGWLADGFFSLSASAYLYFRWPDVFFDDAGFILRYLDQSKAGFWFNYNAGEGPVFGISGFLHGLFSTLLVKVGVSPEAALIASNLMGVFLGFYFLAGIFRLVLGVDFLAYLLAGCTLLLSKFYCNVAFTGMEMPLHVAFILGALYFMLRGKAWPFFLFGAMAVVSKLDAVPVIGAFGGIFVLRAMIDWGVWKGLRSLLLPGLIAFALPVLVWIGFAFWFFGSPLPQSAHAKLLYHSGGIQTWFPFLQWMLEEPYKRVQIGLLLASALVHVFFAKSSKGRSVLEWWSMGWAFCGVMALYYVYNPNERMLWYYSLPDVLLTGQLLLSLAWLGSRSKGEAADTLPYAAACLSVFFLKPNVDGGRNWVEKHVLRLETERARLGEVVAGLGNEEDTLIAWHGLIGRPFPGFVLDGTGLNSKLAVRYGLDCDKMLEGVRPGLGVHHGHSDLLQCFARNGFKIKAMAADVALDGNPAWFVWEKDSEGTTPHVVVPFSKDLVREGEIAVEYPLQLKGNKIELAVPVEVRRGGNLWFAMGGRTDAERMFKLNLRLGDHVVDSLSLSLKASGEVVFASAETQSYVWSLPPVPDSLGKGPLLLTCSSVLPEDSVFLIQLVFEAD